MNKTLRFLALATSVAGMGFLGSCGNNSDDATPSGSATISLVDISGDNGTTLTNKVGDLDFAAGDVVVVKVRTSARATYQVFAGTGANTTNAVAPAVTKNAGDTTLSVALGTGNYAAGNVLKFKVRTTSGADSIVLRLNEAHAVYTATVLTAPLADNSSNTFINFVSGTLYNVTQAAGTAKSQTDAGLFIGGANNHCSTNRFAMFSPDNWTTEPNYYGSLVGGADWNKTRFRIPSLTPNPRDWASTSTVASLWNNGTAGTVNCGNAYIFTETSNLGQPTLSENDGKNSNVSDRANSRVGNLQDGSTFVFRTAAGKIGLARVVDSQRNGATADRAGTLTITYRVQK